MAGSAPGLQVFLGKRRSFNLRPQGLGFFGSPLQISPYFVRMPQAKSNYGINISQFQGIVGANHVFRGHPVLILLHDQVEADAGFANSNNATLI